jgi:hypothetical protein
MTVLRPHHRHGSVLILIAAFLVVLAVLGFGFLGFVTEQRGAARKAQVSGLLRMALTRGRAHAQAVIDGHVATTTTGNGSSLSSPWVTAFSSTATSGAWPNPTSHPSASARIAARLALSNPGNPFAQGNAIDLWRNAPGLASPAATTAWHGFDQGTTVHDGIGRWFEAGLFDQDLREARTLPQAQYRLRYAVAVIDQQGLLAFNKQRYEHRRRSGSHARPDSDAGDLARRDAWYLGANEVPAWDPDRPADAVPNELSDPWSGFQDDVNGTDAVRINTWRPIPADHRYLASSLLAAGFGIRDVQPGFMADGDRPALGGPSGTNSSFGKYKTPGGEAWAQYRERVPGNLPDHLRNQGYLSFIARSLPMSERYGDYLPFEAVALPIAGTEHFVTTRGAQSHIVRLTSSAGLAEIADHLDFPLQSAASAAIIAGLWPGPGPSPSASSSGSPNSARYLRELTREMIRNRHHAHLTNLVNMRERRTLPTNTVVPWSTDMQRFLEHLLIQGVDVPGWQPIGINLRLTGSAVASGRGRRTAGPDDGVIQAFTPFATAMGAFDTVEPASLTIHQRKNIFEMATQFPINIATAPPLVVEAVIRLTCPELPDPDDPGGSPWVSPDSDAGRYARSVTMIRQGIIAWRGSGALVLSTLTTPAEWIDTIPNPAFRSAMQGQFAGTSTARMGLSSSILGGASLRGPVAVFRIRKAYLIDAAGSATASTSTTATRARLVIEGQHASRLFSPQRASNPDLEHRLWLRMTAATGAVPAMGRDDPRLPLAAPGSAQDRRIPDAGGAPAAPFLIHVRNDGSSSVAHSGSTTEIDVLIDPNAPELSPYIGGYAARDRLAAILGSLTPAATDPLIPAGGTVELVGYIDFASERWRPRPGVKVNPATPSSATLDMFQWLNYGPGLCFVTGKSRTYRVAVRARLENVDDPADVMERSWDFVYRSDPDRSLSRAGSTGFLDGDILYQDEENMYQNTGGISW